MAAAADFSHKKVKLLCRRVISCYTGPSAGGRVPLLFGFVALVLFRRGALLRVILG